MQSPHLFCILLITSFLGDWKTQKQLVMEESANNENVQTTPPPKEEQTYQIDYKSPGYVRRQDGSSEYTLIVMAYVILVFGIISVIWSFNSFCFVRSEFKLEGLAVPIAIALSTITSFTLLKVVGNMAIMLKEIQHKINSGQMTVSKRLHSKMQSLHSQPQALQEGSKNANDLVVPKDEDNASAIFFRVVIAVIIVVLIVVLLFIL